MKITILNASGYAGAQEQLESILSLQDINAIKVDSGLPENQIATYEFQNDITNSAEWAQFENDYQGLFTLE
jgi:hypothetical protein